MILKGHKSTRPAIQVDPMYHNLLVARFVNCVMKRGKKSTARKLVYEAMDSFKTKTKKEPLPVFEAALQNSAPQLEVRPTRVGGATYQVPYEVREQRRVTLAIRWIISAARSRKGKPMAEKLAEELILASKNEGEAIKRKINVQKMAEANKAFAHFAR